MKKFLSLTIKMFGLLILSAVLTSTALAQCANLGASAHLKPQAWNPDQTASLVNVTDYLDPLVGMWHVKFISKNNSGIPDGTILDNAFVVIHSDGTEIMNSSRDPETQSFCLGVWAKTAPRTYHVNHFTISWDGVNHNAPLGPGHIQETINLSSTGVTFGGTFSIVQYDQSGNTLEAVQGTLSARRVSVKTPASSIF